METHAPPLLTRHCRLVTDDLDQARAAVGRMWERHHSELIRGRTYDLRWHQADLARLTLSYVQTGSSIRIACGPVSDTVRVTMHLAGRLQHRIDGREAVSMASRAVVHGPGQELAMTTEPFRLLLLTFDGGFVREALERRQDSLPPVEAWAREISLHSPAGDALRKLAVWAAQELDRPSSYLASLPETAGAVEGTLLALLLDTVAEQLPDDVGGCEKLSEARVRVIEEWIDAHLSDPLTVDDLAEVAGVSVRTVQVAFRRRRGCTPMEAVNRRRLLIARELLLSGTSATVTDAALESGFFHFSRFAARYRDAFGETPSQTLTRTRNPLPSPRE